MEITHEYTYTCYKDGCIMCFDYFLNKMKEYKKLMEASCFLNKPTHVCWCDCDKCCAAKMKFYNIEIEQYFNEFKGLPDEDIGDNDVFN